MTQAGAIFSSHSILSHSLTDGMAFHTISENVYWHSELTVLGSGNRLWHSVLLKTVTNVLEKRNVSIYKVKYSGDFSEALV
jgi:hypothetical protein